MEPVIQMFASRIIKSSLGSNRLVIRELWNKFLLWPGSIKLRRFEDKEISRLTAMLPVLPAARVAVIITTYRRPGLLREAVRSALAQTIRDIVVLVVDDGGGMLPDLPPDPRLAVCSLSGNTRVPGIVRNVGIRLTRSEYVAFLDDDNEWEPYHLQVALDALEQTGPGKPPGFVYTALRRCRPDGATHDVLSAEFSRASLGRVNFIDTNAIVLRRFPRLHWSRLRRVPGIRPATDWEFAYRVSRSVKTQHVSIPTVRYRMNVASYFTDWTRQH